MYDTWYLPPGMAKTDETCGLRVPLGIIQTVVLERATDATHTHSTWLEAGSQNLAGRPKSLVPEMRIAHLACLGYVFFASRSDEG